MIELGQRGYLLFDGDCGICTWASEKVKKLDQRQQFVVAPYQSIPGTELIKFGITYAQCDKKLQVISRDGKVYQGAFGLNYFLWQYFPWSVLIFFIYALPILLMLEWVAYAWVARNRHRLSQWFGFKACKLRQ